MVAELNDQIIGWCSGGKNRDEDAKEDIGELWGIYIHPEFIGQSIGTALMNELLKLLRNDGYKKATLWVLDSNQKSRGFYEGKGWKVEGGKKQENRDSYILDETRYIIDL